MLDQRLQQRELARRQLDRLAVAAHLVSAPDRVLTPRCSITVRRGRPARRRTSADPGAELRQVERLDQIVVGARIESRDTVRSRRREP